MSNVDWKKVETIVDEALELPQDEWIDYVEKRCQKSEELKSEVTRLLQSISDSEGWLEDAGLYKEDLITAAGETPDSSPIGTEFGSYRITETIAQGGMGTVYRGERTDGEFEHTVAIKVIRVGMDTQENIRLFNRERNILAGLNHPGIAKLFDGGVLENGAPYLSMEYVEGTQIDQYCDEHQLTIDERIDLFKNVLKAVSHAHENLIIHRDLKPDNILITEQRQVKILDFGIAKLLDTEKNSDDKLSITQARILTPKYAAPEQIQQQSVTTATDLYALGIILYQLLVGRNPYDLTNKTAYETEHTVLNEEPIVPEKRLAQDDESDHLAKKRSSTTQELVNKLKGDLNAILLKAIEKDPENRYRTSDSLLDEFNRYISGLPVSACQNTVRYRLSKFIRRNKAPLAIAATFTILILSFAFYHTQQITQERNQAQLEAEKAEQVTEFLIDLFSASDPAQSLGDTLSVHVIMEQGQKKINQLNRQPEIKSQMLNTMGKVYINLGQYKKAEELLVESLNIQRNNNGSPVEIAHIHNDLGVLHHKASDLTMAEFHYRQALKLRKKRLDTNHPDYAQSLSDLGVLMRVKGNIDSAEHFSKMAYKIRQQISDGNQLDVATSLNNLAVLAKTKGDLDNAEKLYLKALFIREKELGSIHPKIANTLNNIGVLLRTKGEFDRAEKYYQESLNMRITLLGLNHPQTAQSLNNFASLLVEKGDLNSAIRYYRQALDIRKRIFNVDDIKVGNSQNNLANALFGAGQLDEAERLYRNAINTYASILDSTHRYVGIVKSNLGKTLTAKGELNKADIAFDSAYNILQQNYEMGHHISIANLYEYMSELEVQKNNLKNAIRYLENALKIRHKLLGESHPDIKNNITKLTNLRQKLALNQQNSD